MNLEFAAAANSWAERAREIEMKTQPQKGQKQNDRNGGQVRESQELECDKDDNSKMVWIVAVSEEMFEQSKFIKLRTWQGKGEIVR